MVQHFLTGFLSSPSRKKDGVLVKPFPLRQRLLDAAGLQCATLVPEPERGLDFVERRSWAVRTFELPAEALSLPEEILVAIVRRDDHCYCLRGEDGVLLPRGLLFEDSRSLTPALGRGVVTRLTRARACFEQMLQRSLGESLEVLSGIEVHPRVGTLLDSVHRLERLTEQLALRLDRRELVVAARRAALFSKLDLATPLVSDYPELRGHVSAAVALRHGETEEVAQAIVEHHYNWELDAQGPSELGALLQTSDRLQCLASGFSSGVLPTPTADPLDLRRQANELLRTAIISRWPLSLADLVELCDGALVGAKSWLSPEDTKIRLMGFLRHRLKVMLKRRFADEDVHRELLAPHVVPHRVYESLTSAALPST